MLAGLLTVCVFAGTPSSGPRAAAISHRHEFAVVASRSVPVEEVSLSELRQMFLFEKQHWKAGQPLITLFPPFGSGTRSFLMEKVCRLDEAEMRRHIVAKMFRGEMDLAPKVVASDREAVSFVAAGDGLIAIVPAELAPETGAKVLKVAGKLPRSTGYTLTD